MCSTDRGGGFPSRLPVPLAMARHGAWWRVEAPAPSQQVPPGLLGTVQATRVLKRSLGTEVLAARLRHGRVACPPLSLLLGVSVGAVVSWSLSWPGASWQNAGFLSEGTVMTCNVLIIFPIRSGYLQLERISGTLADLTLLTTINPFPFDSNQSLESF